LDLKAIRRDLEARRDVTRERLAVLASRPERGSALGFGNRVGDGTTEAVARLTDIGVGDSLAAIRARRADYGRYLTPGCACGARMLNAARPFRDAAKGTVPDARIRVMGAARRSREQISRRSLIHRTQLGAHRGLSERSKTTVQGGLDDVVSRDDQAGAIV
jgi:hypothetical protein